MGAGRIDNRIPGINYAVLSRLMAISNEAFHQLSKALHIVLLLSAFNHHRRAPIETIVDQWYEEGVHSAHDDFLGALGVQE